MLCDLQETQRQISDVYAQAQQALGDAVAAKTQAEQSRDEALALREQCALALAALEELSSNAEKAVSVAGRASKDTINLMIEAKDAVSRVFASTKFN